MEHVRTSAGARGQLGVVDDPRLAGERPRAHVAWQHDLVELDLVKWGQEFRGSGHRGRRGVGAGV